MSRPQTFTVGEAADKLGISEWTLRAAISRNDAPVPWLRVGRRVVIPRRPLLRLLGMEEAEEP
jgi:excisionase family DNA binding protein